MRFDLGVVGLGYVGLPLAWTASAAALSVAGFDIAQPVVTNLAAGRSHVDDIADAQVAAMLARGFRPTGDQRVLARCDVVVVCVPTPLTLEGDPDLSAVMTAIGTVGDQLRPGMLVVLESTTYPGTTDQVVRPLLEQRSGLTAGVDFHLAFSPERIDPGRGAGTLARTPKIVGGVTRTCTKAATAFYGRFVDTVVEAHSSREAEMAKLVENTYRHVNIALVNELAMFSHETGVDLWDAIACAATKPFGFEAFYPGPGVGGHCIPVDPYYLAYQFRRLGRPFWFVEVAREVNTRMPRYVVERATELLNRHGRAVNGATVLLLGVTYKPDVSDHRESPARPVAEILLSRGARVVYHDPYVTDWSVLDRVVPRLGNLAAALGEAELTILLQDHSVYEPWVLARDARLLFDTRGRLRGHASDTIEVL